MIPALFYSADAPYVKLYSLEHVLYLLFCAAAVYMFVKKRSAVQANRDRIAKVLLGVLLFQQIFLLYGWYLLFSDDFLSEGLPLHLCRISSLLSVWYLIRKDNRVLDVIFYFSIYALTSLFYPMNVYHFAHINGISYMINHLLTVLIPVFGAIAYQWRPGWKGFLRAGCAFTAYLPCAIVANSLTGGNYFYLNQRPFWNSLPAWMFITIAYVVTIGGFAIVTWLLEALMAHFRKKAVL